MHHGCQSQPPAMPGLPLCKGHLLIVPVHWVMPAWQNQNILLRPPWLLQSDIQLAIFCCQKQVLPLPDMKGMSNFKLEL